MATEDVIQRFICENIDASNITIIARRRHALQSACMALRQNYFAWHKTPLIEFVGEEAADYGGPRREFFR